ncbi:auxin-responsive protein SAUR36-like [Lolium rigidum]|uniref:auxin-responsive protein SAUR36-like n=1 Tax=Lolium rigidum TaxID=89674 RepID=UPI001F5C9F62|nr:auxin-responsive protein SAUR36-like [Lolium rigidum]
MISSKKLAHLAKKCQRMVAAGDRQTSGTNGCCWTASMADKGHCVIYSADGTRFEVPLVYLRTRVFVELLRMSQEEFGFTSYGKITLPCDASAMEYLIYLLRREASKEVERAFFSSIVSPCHKTSMGLNQQFAVCI